MSLGVTQVRTAEFLCRHNMPLDLKTIVVLELGAPDGTPSDAAIAVSVSYTVCALCRGGCVLLDQVDCRAAHDAPSRRPLVLAVLLRHHSELHPRLCVRCRRVEPLQNLRQGAKLPAAADWLATEDHKESGRLIRLAQLKKTI